MKKHLPELPLTFRRNSTVGDVARKVMGDVPISYIEGVGGTRVSEEDIVAVGKHDVSHKKPMYPMAVNDYANWIIPIRFCRSKWDDNSFRHEKCIYSRQWSMYRPR